MATELCTPETLESTLTGCWVVEIADLDWVDTTPWSVVAKDIGEAVAKAVDPWEDWNNFPTGPTPDERLKPHVVRVFRNIWITEIEWSDVCSDGPGTFDMSKLSNRPWG